MTTRVDALRSTWRTTAEQRATQAWRVLRLFGAALGAQVIAQLTANGFDLDRITHLDQKAIVALLVAAGEAAWRQLHPALTASSVDTAPGATIVPAQTGAGFDILAHDEAAQTLDRVGDAAQSGAAPDLTAPDDTLDVSSIPADL